LKLSDNQKSGLKKMLAELQLKRIMPSLPAAASHFDCRCRSHPDCRATSVFPTWPLHPRLPPKRCDASYDRVGPGAAIQSVTYQRHTDTKSGRNKTNGVDASLTFPFPMAALANVLSDGLRTSQSD